MQRAKAGMIMVIVQALFAGVNVLYKLAANDGTSPYVIVAYRFLFSAAFIVPIALIFERKNRPNLTRKVLGRAFLCGLFGSMAQNFYLESLTLTSASFASAMAILSPGITFILAISFGLEKLRIRTMAGKAKVLGTLVGIGGAVFLTFYKGIEIDLWSTNINLLKTTTSSGSHSASSVAHKSSDQAFGAMLAICSVICNALWLIIQDKMSKDYPADYSSTALMCVMGSIQATSYALCRERDWSQWKLGFNIRLLTVSYVGIFASGVSACLITWCIRMKGPLFVSIFNPLMPVFVSIAGSMLLDEQIHLGSIIGAGLIVVGLYFVLWGQRKETERMNSVTPLSTNNGQLMDVSHVIEVPVLSPMVSINRSMDDSISPSESFRIDKDDANNGLAMIADDSLLSRNKDDPVSDIEETK